MPLLGGRTSATYQQGQFVTPAPFTGGTQIISPPTDPAAVAATAAGALDLAGNATATASASAAGTLTLSGTASATAGATPATASGSLTLSGSATMSGGATSSGALSLAGSASATVPVAASGGLTLAGAVTGQGRVSGTGALTLAGTATGTVTASASGAVTLGGVGTARAATTAAGMLTLDGTATGVPTATAAGGLSLTGAATARAATAASGVIALSGTGAVAASTAVGGSIALAGTVSAVDNGAPLLSLGARVTQVRLALSAPTSDGTGRRPTGSLEWRPTKRRNVTGDVVLPAPFTVGVGATTPPVVTVAPTGPDWAWQVVERVQGGSPHHRYLAVPDSVTVIDYVDLPEVNPATLEPVAAPEAAWWAVAETVMAGQHLIALDSDGTPYYDPAGVQHPIRLFADVDNVLYFTAA